MVPSARLVHFSPGHRGCHLSDGFQPVWGSALFHLFFPSALSLFGHCLPWAAVRRPG